LTVSASSQLHNQDQPRVFRAYEEGRKLLEEAAIVSEMSTEDLYDYIERSKRFQETVKEAQR